jgi:hypothetical protein
MPTEAESGPPQAQPSAATHLVLVERARTLLERVVRGDPTRPTRFHTANGQLIPPRAWPTIPRAIWRRALGQVDGPWLVPAATREIDRLLTSDKRVLELGAGRSTCWFATRAGFVTTFESDPAWAADVQGRLAESGLSERVDFRLLDSSSFADAVASLPDESVDIVFVDCVEAADRVACAAAARQKIRPGGYLVLDDSDRPRYRPAQELLAGWPILRFSGLKDEVLTATETSIFRRPPPHDTTPTNEARQ